MEIISGDNLERLCDYDFGDHIAVCNPSLNGIYKPAHPSNAEFLIKAQDFRGRLMTLFIDNIRLYNRPVYANAGTDASWVAYLQTYNDLIGLLGEMKENKFIVFTSHEDTPIDSHIKVPDNVLGIHAVNAEFFGDKIHPFPYGLQRRMSSTDKRQDILLGEVERDYHYEPTKLLYINCGLGTERNAKERAYLPNFKDKDWATCRFDKDSKFFDYDHYLDFLNEIRDHKFMICPQGHGLDCHRNWESLYLRRVPVMKQSPYFTRLMQGFPVLFVEDWSGVTKELLEANQHLFEEAQKMSLKKLDLNLIFSAIVKSYENPMETSKP